MHRDDVIAALPAHAVLCCHVGRGGEQCLRQLFGTTAACSTAIPALLAIVHAHLFLADFQHGPDPLPTMHRACKATGHHHGAPGQRCGGWGTGAGYACMCQVAQEFVNLPPYLRPLGGLDFEQMVQDRSLRQLLEQCMAGRRGGRYWKHPPGSTCQELQACKAATRMGLPCSTGPALSHDELDPRNTQSSR